MPKTKQAAVRVVADHLGNKNQNKRKIPDQLEIFFLYKSL